MSGQMISLSVIPAFLENILFFVFLFWVNALILILYSLFNLPLTTPLWRISEFGADPTIYGWIVISLFWLLVAFFLSWFGNLKVDR